MTDNEKENKLRFYIILLFVLTLIAFFLAGLALGKVRRLEEEIEQITSSEYRQTIQPQGLTINRIETVDLPDYCFKVNNMTFPQKKARHQQSVPPKTCSQRLYDTSTLL